MKRIRSASLDSVRRLVFLPALLFLSPVRAIGQGAPAAPPAKSPDPPALSPAKQEMSDIWDRGFAASANGDYPAFLKAMQEGEAKATQYRDALYIAEFNYGLGSAYASINKLDDALKSDKIALKQFIALERDDCTADCLSNMGYTYRAKNQMKQARQALLAARYLYVSMDKKDDLLDCDLNLGAVYLSEGNFPEAMKRLNAVIPAYETAKNGDHLATALLNRGSIYGYQDRLDEAKADLERALPLREAAANKSELPLLLTNLGILNLKLSDYNNAETYLTRALSLQQNSLNANLTALCLQNLGELASEKYRMGQALSYYADTLDAYKFPDDAPRIAALYHSLGNLYSHMGQNEKALTYWQDALTLRQNLKNSADIAASQMAVGMGEAGRRNYKAALIDYTAALKRFKKLGTRRGMASVFINTAAVYNDMKDYTQAASACRRAAAQLKGLPDGREAFDLLIEKSITDYKRGRYGEALRSSEAAAKIAKKLDNRFMDAVLANNSFQIYFRLSRMDKMETMLDRALEMEEALSRQVGDPAAIAQLETILPTNYTFYAWMLANSNHAGKALVMAERGRTQAAKRSMTLAGANYTGSFTSAEAAELAKDSDDLAAANARLRYALSATGPAAKKNLEARQKEQQAAERKYSLLREKLLQKYPQAQQALGEKPFSLADFKALAQAHPDTLYVEWEAFGKATTLCFALSQQDGLRDFLLPADAIHLAAIVHIWHDALRDSQNPKDDAAAHAEKTQARALYDALLAPLAKAGLLASGRYRHLVLVSSGPLLSAPLAALMAPDGKRLMDHCPVSTAISLNSLLWPRQAQTAPASLLCVADPQGGKEKKRALASRRAGFDPLPYARQEGIAITNLFGPSSELLVGTEARKAKVMAEMGKYAILHFATHGYLDEEGTLFSGLALAPDAPEKGDDGILEAREIMNLPLTAQLVTLSACVTDAGAETGGEGVMGVAWAFCAAGCPSVVASQWQVSDKATQMLMTEFYTELKAGKDKDAALRGAMQLTRKTYPSPHYWAAFRLIGDSSP